MPQAQIPQEDIVGYECRHVVHVPPGEDSADDLHFIKEIIHTKDGQRIPSIRSKLNYQRDIWITRKGFQNHQDKKEREELTKLIPYKTTQSGMMTTIARAIGKPGFRGKQRALFRSPYIYGADILSTAILKRHYMDNWPELNTPYTVACYDTETDVLHGTGHIMIATVSMKDKVYTAVQKSFLQDIADPIPGLFARLEKYLGKHVEKRGINWEVEIVDSEIEVVKRSIGKCHEWMPDLLTFWNVDFDMNKILDACKRANVHPASIFSDPSLPKKWQYFEYIQGQKKKVTENGKETPIKPHEQWHTAIFPASFYVIDAMCVYKRVRVAEGEEQSYSLDYILQKNLGERKLTFEEANHVNAKLKWHQFMQKNYPMEYVIYNVFDCVGIELLDEKTMDLSLMLPMFSRHSDFRNFKSQPRRVVDDLHFFLLKRGWVIGTTSDEMTDELDDDVVSVNGWIVTLAAYLVEDNGLQNIAEYPGLRTNIRIAVADLDVAGSYPNGEVVHNVSKETTKKELSEIHGVPEEIRRSQGINLSGGHVNAIEISTFLFGMPDPDEFLDAFVADLDAQGIAHDCDRVPVRLGSVRNAPFPLQIPATMEVVDI